MMRLLTISVALGVLLNARPAAAQTAEIQQKVTDALAQGRALEDMLAQALKDNPDIRVAESKLREAEAELNRARLLVTQKVVAHKRDIATLRTALVQARASLTRLQLQNFSNVVSAQTEAARLEVQKLQADLARQEDELHYLLGQRVIHSIRTDVRVRALEALSALNVPAHEAKKAVPSKEQTVETFYTLVQEIKPSTRLPTDMADRLRKALDTPVKVDFQKASPKDILDFLQQHATGINIVSNVRLLAMTRDASDNPTKKSTLYVGDKVAPVDLQLAEPVPLGAVFQFLEDHYGWRFVIRDYGIVIAEPRRIPPGAVYLQDFWKNRPTQAATTTTERKK